MITAKEARKIPVKETKELKQLTELEICEAYIREAAESGERETEVFSMPDDLKETLKGLGYSVELTPIGPRLVSGWTISW